MHNDLLGAPSPTLLPDDAPVRDALAAGTDPAEVAAAHPAVPAAWAALAEGALAADDSTFGSVTAYAFARTGYHRGLDLLRRAGWKGHGPVPWSHEANRGFLRALNALGLAAERIGETEEAERCATFLGDSDPEAFKALRG
ncbi:conserved hypothetical protein [Catenulispora acidiphila DSM 44928]|uniref:DUF3151 domain-containing protein n=1 Tax=Catenulispora acidiphila (strain DSM 44928 / JCM 14897 / NBRC 102108 / NRRL B-24433 / ID139908) TaxID=479433 RepID=C7QIB0_CATAD|nr:DUF3151 domain-containing protein [Catenulispora acidiphila]ACU74987.1 conserved hypothetical protein [Catenulispora acidiphila DSM 44928]